MRKYSMNMNNEKEPAENTVFEKGWHSWEITKIEEKTSKAGNEMFVITLAEESSFKIIEVFAVATEGKRWFLKQFLTACGVKNDDGVYDWDADDLIGTCVKGHIENEPNTYIDREGITRNTIRSKVTKFEEYGGEVQDKRLKK